MITIKLTKDQYKLIVKILTYKVKEIHAWRIATKSQVRDERYTTIATLLKQLMKEKED